MSYFTYGFNYAELLPQRMGRTLPQLAYNTGRVLGRTILLKNPLH